MANRIRIDDVLLNERQIRACTRIINKYAFRTMPCKKIDKDKYEIYCPNCDTYTILNSKQFKNVRSQKECPICFHDYIGTTHKHHRDRKDYLVVDGRGYEFLIEWNYGESPTCKYYIMMADFTGLEQWIRTDWALGGFGNIIYRRGETSENIYRLCRSYYLKNNFTFLNREEHGQYWIDIEDGNLNRKNQLEKYITFPLKSNQKRLIVSNYVSILQAKFIKVFDLKTIEEVWKYSTYMKRNEAHIEEYMRDNISLNVYYLDYLWRNKIDLGDYYTFLVRLKKLGFKNEKPKDFLFRYTTIENMFKDEQEKKLKKSLELRTKQLPTYEYENVKILPFYSAYEIRHCGKVLHNCIAGYVQSYADGRTDLYHLDLDGAIKVAIEIRGMELKQAYIESNKKCPTPLMKHIAKFCEQNGIKLGRYANA